MGGERVDKLGFSLRCPDICIYDVTRALGKNL